MVKKKSSAKKTAPAAKKKPAAVKKKPEAAKKNAKTARQNISVQDSNEGFIDISPEIIQQLPPAIVEEVMEAIRNAMAEFQYMSDENLTTLQRRRKTGAGIRNYGFIDKVSDLADANPKYARDFKIASLKNAIRNIEICRDIVAMLDGFRRMASNSMLVYSTDAYAMALIFYNTVQTMARRGDPVAQGIFDMLRPFFHRTRRSAQNEPTVKELERDIHALLKGKKDGKIVIENESPKITGGKKVRVDNTRKSKAAFKEIDEGEIVG